MHSPRLPRSAIALGAGILLLAGQLPATASVLAADGPDLAVRKTSLATTLVAGSPASYTLDVKNVGTASMPGPITVTDTLPPALTFVSASGTGWTCSAVGQVVTCTTPGPLAASATLPTITLTVQVGPAGAIPASIDNCASVTGGGGATGTPADVNPQNDRSCTSTKTSTTQEVGTLCIVKFNDLNGDGKQDPGEPLLAGWSFTVLNTTTSQTGTLVTGSDGRICRDVPPGSYTVTEVVQSGWTQTAPTPVGPVSVTVVAGQTTTIAFGNHQGETKPGTLCIVKFNDLNGDGKQDPGEPFLAGWSFTVTSASGVVITLTTGPDGRICRDLPAGTYTVTEIAQPGWTQTAPTPVGPVSVTIAAGQTTTLTFGNQKTACCLTFVFGGGKKDGFSLSDGAAAEPAVPAPAPPATNQTTFDWTAINRRFSHRISLPIGNCIQSATYEIRVKPLKDKPKDDTITLKIPGTGGTTWTKSLNALSVAATPSYPWVTGKPARTYTWNLGSMPLGGANLVASLNTLRVLDTYVQDDTSVDYIRLTVVFCECTNGTTTGGTPN
jgi:uncharacterized repeat protein (TIGR01451 family)